MTLREHLASWVSRATPIATLLDQLATLDAVRDPEALADLAMRVARSVLVDPVQSLRDVNVLVERFTMATVPTVRLAALDLVNALMCAGAAIRPDLEAQARRGLGELAGVGPPLALRMHVGFAAIVYGEFGVATQIVPEMPTLFFGDEEFPNDVLALLGYAAARVGAGPGRLDAAWHCVANELAELCASGQLDELAVLWLARVVFQRYGNEPVERVAALAHDHLWANREPAPMTSEEPEFPVTDTLGGGAYRVEHHLRGRGQQTLWMGREVATGHEVLVACDLHNPDKQDVSALRRAVDYQVPGVFELAFVGTFDTDGKDYRRDAIRAGEWAIVEKVTAGCWLPRVLGPADPWTAPAKAIELGRSAGQILLRAAEAGIKLVHIRPELMWAERRNGHIAITGLSPRATELFARKVGEMVTHPVFDRFYHAPESRRDPDDRAIAYSLAVMIAEWATGRYPFESRYAPNGVETAVHEPIVAPRPLARLLEATIRRDRNERPRLAEFVGELERMTL